MTTTVRATARTRSLFQHWIHSREEDIGALEVYRPEGFALPVSFGRDGFAMRPDGSFVQEDLGPADGVVGTSGRWTMPEPWVITASLQGRSPSDQPRVLTFEVVAVDDTVLRIVRRSSPAEPPKPDTELVRLDFDRARVITRHTPEPQHVLQVIGTKPSANMDVELVPLVYVQQPDYWEIEVIGSPAGVGLPAEAPYDISLPITSTLGRHGIEVVGARRRKKIDITAPEC